MVLDGLLCLHTVWRVEALSTRTRIAALTGVVEVEHVYENVVSVVNGGMNMIYSAYSGGDGMSVRRGWW